MTTEHRLCPRCGLHVVYQDGAIRPHRCEHGRLCRVDVGHPQGIERQIPDCAECYHRRRDELAGHRPLPTIDDVVPRAEEYQSEKSAEISRRQEAARGKPKSQDSNRSRLTTLEERRLLRTAKEGQ